MKYLIYGSDGKVWREVDNWRQGTGQIEAGINGTYTLIYPDSVNIKVLEITDDAWAAMNQQFINLYSVVNGVLTAPTEFPVDVNVKIQQLATTVALMDAALAKKEGN